MQMKGTECRATHSAASNPWHLAANLRHADRPYLSVCPHLHWENVTALTFFLPRWMQHHAGCSSTTLLTFYGKPCLQLVDTMPVLALLQSRHQKPI